MHARPGLREIGTAVGDGVLLAGRYRLLDQGGLADLLPEAAARGRSVVIIGPGLAPLRRDFTLSELAPRARAAGVAGMVPVQTVTVAEETPELLALAASDDLVAGVVGWTDLAAADVASDLAALREAPGGEFLVGVATRCRASPPRTGWPGRTPCAGSGRWPRPGSHTTCWCCRTSCPRPSRPPDGCRNSPSSSTTWVNRRSGRGGPTDGGRPSGR
ncbi:hypothetical protein GCM10025734_11810 [Kitasatospora paranensis]